MWKHARMSGHGWGIIKREVLIVVTEYVRVDAKASSSQGSAVSQDAEEVDPEERPSADPDKDSAMKELKKLK